MHSRTRLALGGALVAIAFIGFLAVADELRHIGEFFAVLGLLLSGAALLVAGWFPRTAFVLALSWVPLGIALGELVGAFTDRVVLGVSIGTAVGLVLARLRRTRHSPSSPQQPPP